MPRSTTRTLAIENHGNALLDSLDSFKAFVDLNQSPRLGIALAPYHLQALGVSVEKAIEICGQQLFFFYAWQQADGTEQLPGHGPTDFSPWIAALADAGYGGYVNPFMHGDVRPDAMSQALAKSRDYLERCDAASKGRPDHEHDGTRFQRRQFMAAAGAALAVPYFIPSGVLASPGKPGANDRLTVAHIGVGGMGSGHLQRMTKFRDEGKVNIAAVCDVDETRWRTPSKLAGAGVQPYRDYRHICLRKDIDAVVIATPDHWHAVQTVHACETGKHVYVEKPASVTVREGRAMVTAARETSSDGASRCSRTNGLGRLLHLPRDSQRHRGQGQTKSPAGTTRIRSAGLSRTRRRQRNWIGICGWGRCAGDPTTRPIIPRTSAGSSSPAAGRSAIAVLTSSARSSGAWTPTVHDRSPSRRPVRRRTRACTIAR